MTVPAVPWLHVAFALMIVGIAFVTWSRQVRLKRVVLPITGVLFGVIWMEIVWRALRPPIAVLTALAIVYLGNYVHAVRRIHYCTRCGLTLQDGRRRRLCAQCAFVVKRGRAADAERRAT